MRFSYVRWGTFWERTAVDDDPQDIAQSMVRLYHRSSKTLDCSKLAVWWCLSSLNHVMLRTACRSGVTTQ